MPEPATVRNPEVQVEAAVPDGLQHVLSPAAIEFVADLQRRFGGRREALLHLRGEVAAALAAGALPDFPRETAARRAAEWRIADVPAELRDRRVEITGPPDRKMIINALNS